MENNKSIILIGASGHGKVVAEILESSQKKIDAFLDENVNVKSVWNYKVLHNLNENLLSTHHFIVSIGNNISRKKIAEQHPFQFTKALHIKSVLSSRTTIGIGTVAMAGAIVNTDCEIGNHVILNTGCTIDHDCSLKNYVHISPGASIAGNVTVGEGTHIGIGASIVQNIKIGKYCKIGAGAVVLNDIPDYAVAVGVPAKIIRFDY